MAPFNKMVVLNANIDTFSTPFEPCFFLLLFLNISASIAEHFWGEAALTAVYTMNRVPSPTTLNTSLNSCMVLLQIISPSKSLDAFVLYFLNLMNTLN
jgi:hypothetical protein